MRVRTQYTLIILMIVVGLGIIFTPMLIRIVPSQTAQSNQPVTKSLGVTKGAPVPVLSKPVETLDKVLASVDKIVGSATSLIGLIMLAQKLKKHPPARRKKPVRHTT